MIQRSKKEQFYREVAEAMSMNNMRSFINMETLEVDIHAGKDHFFFEDEEDTAREALANPDKFLAIEPLSSSDSFRVMEAFTETVNDKGLQRNLIRALERKRPFANFKFVIDNSLIRQTWFQFRDEAYMNIAKEWIDANASGELKEKIKSLSSLFLL
jgi:hypothetical protein